MANSMIYNDIDLSGPDYGFLIRKGEFPQAPAGRVNVMDLAQRHGGINQGGYRAQMQMNISGVVIGTSYLDLCTKIDNLSYVLNPENGDKNIKLDHRAGRYWVGRLTSPIMPPTVGVTTLSLDMTFSVYPTAYANVETEQIVTETVFNVPASGVVAGVVEALPIWKIRNTDAATVTSVTLANVTTSQTITLTQSIPQNHYIRFDSDLMYAEYSTDDITWTSAMPSLSTTEKTFPQLSPRVQNACTVTGVTTGYLTITYRARY